MTIQHLPFAHQITKVRDTHSCGRIAQSVQRLPTGLTVRRSNTGGHKIFAAVQTGPGAPQPRIRGYRVFFFRR